MLLNLTCKSISKMKLTSLQTMMIFQTVIARRPHYWVLLVEEKEKLHFLFLNTSELSEKSFQPCFFSSACHTPNTSCSRTGKEITLFRANHNSCQYYYLFATRYFFTMSILHHKFTLGADLTTCKVDNSMTVEESQGYWARHAISCRFWTCTFWTAMVTAFPCKSRL